MITSLRKALVFAVLLLATSTTSAADPAHLLHSFERVQLSDQFFGEGANAADLNRDGHVDIISGPYWYAGPDFTERAEFYNPKEYSIHGYSDNFFVYTHDFNHDGWLDIFIICFPGKEAFWYQNPQGTEGHWKRHLAFKEVDNESPTFTDVTGDGQPELVFHTKGRLGFAEIPTEDPTALWKFQPVSKNLKYAKFTHGFGVGDVDGDGRSDLLVKDGWWQQPADGSAKSNWEYHAVPFAKAGGAQMLVYDVDGDGDNDVVTSKWAHGYGLAWFEHIAHGEEIHFTEHQIMGQRPEENDYGLVFSQLHALTLADIDRDGVLDIVTGKRFWAHRGLDPGGHDPPVSYWFRTVRGEDGVRFIPYQIDNNSGVGTQVVVTDLNKDQLPDVLVGSKKGTFALLHHTKQVDHETWKKAQPKPRAQEIKLDKKAKGKAGDSKGIKATDAEGRALNFDFEVGDARDWTTTGDAFNGQPVWGDKVHARRSDSISGQIGNRWVGTFEIAGDKPTGTMTSATFPINHSYAAFYIGGGSSRQTRVEIVRANDKEVIFEATGKNAEQMRPVAVDLRKHQGQKVFLRLVDESSAGWGHINFDHFRFYDSKPQISVLTQKMLELDEYPHAGLSAKQSVEEMILPEGFRVTPFASEPDIKQPIAMALDDRGRVWVAEAYAYPFRAEKGKERDRILIFEDTDGDGRFDTRKVFAEGLNLVSGLEIGHGGVWVGAAPYLLFIPDRNHDDVPDSEPKILLDGWGYQDTHETLNAFCWGPDGWLYGCHGVFTHSRVGKPGTPNNQRTPLNAAVWRYHPLRHEFEAFAQGTSNPWGVDFNDHGQAVVTACVIPHLFHMIQGGRYFRQGGVHFNKYTYDDIETIADHLHYLGDTPHSGNEKSDSAGGGHAHAGAMIYLGGAWPGKYRNHIFMNNIHGQRLNTDILKPRGSGLVGSHGPDFLLTQDRASQMLNLRYGPDGQVYIIDWYDMQACHERNSTVHDRSNGRIYKVSYGDSAKVTVDLTKKSDRELAEMMLNANDWYVRHARRILQERAAAGTVDSAASDRLLEIATTHSDDTRRLRAMWALHVIGKIDQQLRDKLLADASPYVRSWAIQLWLETNQADKALLTQLTQLATNDPSAVVRLYISSALQRISMQDRWPIISALASHAEDANDHNLPLMYWYAAEPLAEIDQSKALDFALASGKTIPLLRKFMLRRLGSIGTPESLAVLVRALKGSADAEQQAILTALRQALQGRRTVTPPKEWGPIYTQISQSENRQLTTQATALGVKFGDPTAMNKLRRLVTQKGIGTKQQLASLQALLDAKDPQLVGTLLNLLSKPNMRGLALSGLAAYDDPKIPEAILGVYDSLQLSEKQRALATLSSRAGYALKLLQAVEKESVSKADLSADIVRQMNNLKDEQVKKLLTDIWGSVRVTAEDKVKLIKQYHKLMSSKAAKKADLELGRAVFTKTCQQCHTLYGVGDTIGPDLTGSNRANLDYLLSNIVDPGALISKEYQNSVIVTDGGRVLTGIVTKEDDNAITMRTATETIVLPKDEIEERSLSDTSMMPDNQLKQFSSQQIISLLAYLQAKSQNPLLATADNAKSMFNRQDLTGWKGEEGLWSVENGELIGRSNGLDHNSFLISDLTAENFQLSLEVMLKDNAGNSGIHFRSRARKGFTEMFGYQADIGAGWWGKLYEEHGRELLWDKSGEQHLLTGQWNKYVIRAEGTRIKTWLNGKLCVDLDDPEGEQRGIFALQLHSGGPTEVRFKNFELEILESPK